MEILALALLYSINKKNALSRGREPALFIALTFVWWLVMEAIGLLIGVFLFGGGLAYLLAIVFAAVGGLISYLMARNCKPGYYMIPSVEMSAEIMQNADPLAEPAAIRLIRYGSFVGVAVRWSFTLNEQPIGTLANGEEISTCTYQKQNILKAIDGNGSEAKPLTFDIQSGSNATIYFVSGNFMPAQCTGIYPLSAPVRQNTTQEATTSA